VIFDINYIYVFEVDTTLPNATHPIFVTSTLEIFVNVKESKIHFI